MAFDVAFGQGKGFVHGILKIAFNCLAYLTGPDEARSTVYQGVRDFVLNRTGQRHVILNASQDNLFSLGARAPWKSPDGRCAIEVRVGTIQFLVDLSENESLYPTLVAKAKELYGKEGWSTLPS